MNIGGPVFKNHPFLDLFWDKHPTPAAIDATFLFLKNLNVIRDLQGSPILRREITREEKLEIIREALKRFPLQCLNTT